LRFLWGSDAGLGGLTPGWKIRPRAPHSVQVARRGVESRIEQNRRDKEGQSEIRFDLDARRERQEGKTGARERKERRIGNFKPTREPGNKHGAARHRKV
jgi:hypothetical protein